MTIKVSTKYLQFGVRIKEAPIVNKAARRAAPLIRKQIRAGQQYDGTGIPAATDDEARKPMRRTQQLIRSIKSRPARRRGRRARVEPTGKRADGKDNYAIALFQRKRVRKLVGLSRTNQVIVQRVLRDEFDRRMRRRGFTAKTRRVR